MTILIPIIITILCFVGLFWPYKKDWFSNIVYRLVWFFAAAAAIICSWVVWALMILIR
jgi:hypothetical protein